MHSPSASCRPGGRRSFSWLSVLHSLDKSNPFPSANSMEPRGDEKCRVGVGPTCRLGHKTRCDPLLGCCYSARYDCHARATSAGLPVCACPSPVPLTVLARSLTSRKELTLLGHTALGPLISPGGPHALQGLQPCSCPSPISSRWSPYMPQSPPSRSRRTCSRVRRLQHSVLGIGRRRP